MRGRSNDPRRSLPRKLGLAGDVSGATAVEFALLMPVLCLMAFGVMALTLGLLQWNVIENVSAETARCLAIGSANCASVPDSCGAEAGACFVMQLASQRGLPGTTADQIAINRAAMLDGISYTAVSITYPFRFLGFQTTLTSTNRYPNQS